MSWFIEYCICLILEGLWILWMHCCVCVMHLYYHLYLPYFTMTIILCRAATMIAMKIHKMLPLEILIFIVLKFYIEDIDLLLNCIFVHQVIIDAGLTSVVFTNNLSDFWTNQLGHTCMNKLIAIPFTWPGLFPCVLFCWYLFTAYTIYFFFTITSRLIRCDCVPSRLFFINTASLHY